MIENLFSFIIIYIILAVLVVLIIAIFPYILKHIERTKKNKEIRFDEFDDIDKIRKQEENSKQEMKYEYRIINSVLDKTFDYATKETYIDEDGIPITKQNNQKKKEATVEDIRTFKLLDSVEVEEEKIPEGSIINSISETEKNFDVELFKKWSKQIFWCIKIGTEEQLKLVKNFIVETMYDKLIYQNKQLENDGLKFVTEDLLIEDIILWDYAKAMSKEEIKVLVKARMKEYIIDNKNGNIVRGDATKSYEKAIVMTFVKKNIEENTENEGHFLRDCPNCNAKISQTELGKCVYCGTIIFPIRYNWILTKFETM